MGASAPTYTVNTYTRAYNILEIDPQVQHLAIKAWSNHIIISYIIQHTYFFFCIFYKYEWQVPIRYGIHMVFI